MKATCLALKRPAVWLASAFFKRNIFPHAGMDMRRIRLHTKCTTIYPTAFASFCKFAQITTDHINRYMPFSRQIGRKDAPVTL